MTQDDKIKSNKLNGTQDPNKIDKAGRTKLFSSIRSGNLEKVKDLLSRGANVNHRDHAGWTPLHEAALKGQYEMVRLLIQNGATVNVRGIEDGTTPLHDACSMGYADCVKLFIDTGADVYALDSDKNKPIDLCEDSECIQVLKNKMNELDQLALIDSHGRSCLHRACLEGSLHHVLHCLRNGINVNTKDKSHQTPLHLAVQSGHLEIIKALIEHGADINHLDSTNSNILHIACQNSHQNIAQYLVDAGVDVHVKDENGKTPYQMTDSTIIKQMITDCIEAERRLRATTEAIDETTFISQSKQIRNSSSALDASQDVAISREERKLQAIMKAFEKAEKKKLSKQTKSPSETAAAKQNSKPRERSNSITSNESSKDATSRKRKLRGTCLSNDLFDTSAILQAREISSQHLPKKRFKPAFNIKTNIPIHEEPNSPIPTPPPENSQQASFKTQHFQNNTLNYIYTIQLYNSNQLFVLDFQISSLLGLSKHQLKAQYPHLSRQKVTRKEKDKLWLPLSAMLCASDSCVKQEKQKFLEQDIDFICFDEILTLLKHNYHDLTENLTIITLDTMSLPPSPLPSPSSLSLNLVHQYKYPPKIGMKMKKFGLLKK